MSEELIPSSEGCPLNLEECFAACPQQDECPLFMKKLAKGSAKYLGVTDADRVKDGLDVVDLKTITEREYIDAELLFNDDRLPYPYGELSKISTGTLKGHDFMKEVIKVRKFFNLLKEKGYDINKVLIKEQASTQKYNFTGRFGANDFEMYSPIKIEEQEIDDQHLAVRMVVSSLIRGVGFQSLYGAVFTRASIQERCQQLLSELEGKQTPVEAQDLEAEAAAVVQADILGLQAAAAVGTAMTAFPMGATISETISQIPPKERDYKGATALLMALGSYVSLLLLNARFGVKPEAICGPLPLYSVQMTERARSDRQLKNRAIGDVFLAHQKGNRDIFRIDGTLVGPLRYTYLWILVQLQKEGQGRAINLGKKIAGAISMPYMPIFSEGAPAAIEEMETAAKGQLNYEIHNTFPIITQFQILTDMYLQTMEWHRAIENGQEVIKYHLLFRKYFPTNVWRAFNPIGDPEEENPIAASKFKVYTLGRKYRQWIEIAIDGLWKTWKMFGEIYPHLALQTDGRNVVDIDKEALFNFKLLSISYAGKLFGLFT